MVCRVSAVTRQGTTGSKGRPRARLPVCTAPAIRRDGATTAIAGAKGGLTPDAAVVSGTAAVAALRTAVAKGGPGAGLAIEGTTPAVRRDIGGDGAVSKSSLAPHATVVGGVTTVAAHRAAAPKVGARARLVAVGWAARAVDGDVAGGAGAEERLAPRRLAVGGRVAAPAVGGAARAKGGAGAVIQVWVAA
jgi:hypothetical protein